MRMTIKVGFTTSQSLHGQLKLGQMAAMTEKEFSVTQTEFEASRPERKLSLLPCSVLWPALSLLGIRKVMQ